jgi:thiol:disulfide interchange protein DsbD
MHRCLLGLVFLLGAICCDASARAAEAPAKVTIAIEPDAEAAPLGGALGVEVFATIARGWHINAHKPNQSFAIPTELTLTIDGGVQVDPINYPRPDKKTFAFAGGSELLVYEGKIGMTTALRIPGNFSGERLRLEAVLRYQACDDTTCLRPTTASASLELPVVPAAASANQPDNSAPRPVDTHGAAQLGRWLTEHGLLFTLAAIAVLGLSLNLTPCVYPLISVTIAYFGAQAGSRRRVGLLALFYVIGIALSFSALGVVAALSGELFGAALQQPVVVLFIAAVMVTLALGSFGLYELRPPAVLVRWVGGAASGTAGALFMGLTMGIVAAPCVGPIVVGLLIFVGSRQDLWLGFLLFFVLALGMGAPYLVLATAAGSLQRLPRSGEWLLWTERLFGCVLLCMAAYYVAPLLPDQVEHWLLPAAVAVSGIYLGFVERAGRSLRYFPLVKGAVGTAMIAVAVWFALPAGSGAAIAWEPFESFASRAARHDGERPLLIDFGAEWCIPCREMDHSTYVHPDVVREADRFRMVKADITEENDATSKLVDEYMVKGVPTVILFTPAGEETRRMVGYVGPDEMLSAMREVR